ncbi:hypothetical protein PIB30_040456 [Stylosanthes scabra]|uniref:Putative plant transposon protein domain-containing protein n=1 Tax=Stylosanthes scabra TaxID=79078 RepID=A0ABU6WCR9_9FABA|nr:hypothetical protein [Stylosanthes scabra]
MARPPPLDGAAARPEIAKIHHHWSHRAPARLARPRDGLGAPAHCPWRTCALALGALGSTTGRAARPRPSDCAPARAHQSTFLGPHLRARPRGSATPSRVRASSNSNRERGNNFPNDRFDHQIHYDRWKGLVNRGIVHERIVRIDREKEPIFHNRIQGLGWRFMYDDLVRINLSGVHEFCANFSSAKQEYVFLRGKKIPFTKAHIRYYLGIPGDAPDADVDDAFVALAKTYERGEDVNMAPIHEEIGRPEPNWADNPAIHIIPKTVNNSVLNERATAWHKIIMANIDPKTHGTKFDLKHAFLIYVLMTKGDVNLPRIMRDFLLVRPTKHPNHLLPFPVFIMWVANRCEVPEFPNDQWTDTGERVRGPVRQRRQPPSQDEPAEQLHQPETSAAPSASAQPAIDRSYQQIMRHLEMQERLLHRQGRQITNTQLMIRQVFPDTIVEGLVSDDSGGSTEAES